MVDEIRDRVYEDHHDDDRDDDRRYHHDQMLRQSHRRDDRIYGEDDIHHHDGTHSLTKPDPMTLPMLLGMLGLDLCQGQGLTQLDDALVDEIGTPCQHHQIPNAETMVIAAQVDIEQHEGHMHEPTSKAEEQTAHHQRSGQAELPADMLLLRWKAIGREGDEDDIVYP